MLALEIAVFAPAKMIRDQASRIPVNAKAFQVRMIRNGKCSTLNEVKNTITATVRAIRALWCAPRLLSSFIIFAKRDSYLLSTRQFARSFFWSRRFGRTGGAEQCTVAPLPNETYETYR